MKYLHPSLEEWAVRKGPSGVSIEVEGSNEVVCDMFNTGEGLNGMERAELIRLAPRCRRNLDGLLSVLKKQVESNMTDAEFRRVVRAEVELLEDDHINPKGRQPYP
jgi:hypothetical protein